MKILLTGSTGQIGRQLRGLLPSIGETYAADRGAIDLARPESTRAVIREFRPDVIVNAAAYTAVDKAESEPALAHAINGIAPGVMAEEARTCGALLMHYSTDYVFDGKSTVPYIESDTPHPVNEYGRSKLAGETAVTAAGGAYLILRASWVYDARGDSFLAKMLNAAETHDELRVVDDQTGSPTWARAIAEASVGLLRNASRIRQSPGIYHMAAAGAVNRYDFVRRALELASGLRMLPKMPRIVPAKTVEFPLPAARPCYSALASGKICEAFGVGLQDWENQLKRCLNERHGPREI